MMKDGSILAPTPRNALRDGLCRRFVVCQDAARRRVGHLKNHCGWLALEAAPPRHRYVAQAPGGRILSIARIMMAPSLIETTVCCGERKLQRFFVADGVRKALRSPIQFTGAH